MHRLRGLRPRMPRRSDLPRRQSPRRLERVHGAQCRGIAQVPGDQRKEGRPRRRVVHSSQEVIVVRPAVWPPVGGVLLPAPDSVWGFFYPHFSSSLEIASPPLRLISLLRTTLLTWLVIDVT